MKIFSKTKPRIIPTLELFNILNLDFKNRKSISKTLSNDGVEFDFLASKMGINLTTGQKGSGKSYFSKRLLFNLIKEKVDPCF